MKIIFGVLSVLLIFILGSLMWQVVKAKSWIKSMLKKPTDLKNFTAQLNEKGYYQKAAEDVSETGKLWESMLAMNSGYETVIGFEAQSSMTSFTKPRNILAAFILIILVLSYFYLPLVFLFIALAILFLSYLIPLGDSGLNRATHELSAMSWLVYKFYKVYPQNCKKFFELAHTLQNLYLAVISLP